MQLKTRLTFQFIVVVAPILLVSFAIIYYSSSNYRQNEFLKRLKNKAITTAEFLIKVEQVDSALLKVIDRTQKDNLIGENISIYNYRNQEIYSNNDSIYFKVNKRLLDKIRLNESITYKEGKYEIIGLTYNDKYNRFVVIAGAYDKYGLSKLKNLRTTLIILFFSIIGIVAVVGRVYSDRALKPITAVINEAEKISPNNLSSRLNKSKYDDEIGRLINTFNILLGRIEQAFKLQKLFVASASHELKNPLTVITSQLEISLLNERSNEEYKQTITSVLEDIKDLNKLTIQLMELARISYDSKDIPYKYLRIDDVLWSTKEFIVNKYPNYNYEFKIVSLPREESRLHVYGNETLLKTAFINLAENACKFSPDHKVIVSLECGNEKLKIVFENNGQGIIEEDLNLIFEPFYRSKSTAEIKGHGLGLALVYQILKLHKANIEIITGVNTNTFFIINFDKNSNDILIST